jgi:two-component system chemotaxis sensor kinase CheA
LVALADAARVSPVAQDRELVVLVIAVQEREIGVLGILPVDAIETDAELDEHTHRQKGLAGSAIINNVTTLVVDLPGLLSDIINGYTAAPPVAEPDERSRVPVASHPRMALVVEDSDFFRAQVKKYLAAEGIEALEARDGESALTVLNNRPSDVGIVITDIEMPGISGLELTRRIRSQARFENLPVIALSALVGEEDLERGREAGLTDYQVKLDRDALIESVERLLDNPDAGNRPFHAAGVGSLVYTE